MQALKRICPERLPRDIGVSLNSFSSQRARSARLAAHATQRLAVEVGELAWMKLLLWRGIMTKLLQYDLTDLLVRALCAARGMRASDAYSVL